MLSPQISHHDPLELALIRKAESGERGANQGRIIATGDGWRASDVLCTCGPRDRPFEERYASAAISLVVSGSFVYRSDSGASLMSSGAILLGNAGHSFECSHQHGEGDRCLAFQFDADLLDYIARDTGTSQTKFEVDRIPPLRALAPIATRARLAMERNDALEEIALDLAGAVLPISSHGHAESPEAPARDRDRIVGVIRHLESTAAEPHTVASLARIAGLSRYHFLRTFKCVTGITPHQWILRARLRDAAELLADGGASITDVALDVGFEDLSNFIRSFRAEFGVSPSKFRAAA